MSFYPVSDLFPKETLKISLESQENDALLLNETKTTVDGTGFWFFHDYWIPFHLMFPKDLFFDNQMKVRQLIEACTTSASLHTAPLHLATQFSNSEKYNSLSRILMFLKRNKEPYSESFLSLILKMVSVNLFRSLPHPYIPPLLCLMKTYFIFPSIYFCIYNYFFRFGSWSWRASILWSALAYTASMLHNPEWNLTIILYKYWNIH